LDSRQSAPEFLDGLNLRNLSLQKTKNMSRGKPNKNQEAWSNQESAHHTEKPDLGRQEHGIHPIVTGPPGQVKYGHVLTVKLPEFKKGRLYNRAGKLVTRRNQAVNIARYEARLAGARNVPKEGKAEKTKALEALQKRRTGLRKPVACLLTPPRSRAL